MPAAPTTTQSPAGFTLDRDRNTIRFMRELAGSPADAFAAWTDPAVIALWWDPTGERLTTCDVDLRVGGSFAFVGRNHPDRPFCGIYREISPPHLLVFDAMGAEGRVNLAEQDGGTRMTVEIVCRGPEHLEQFVNMGVAAGTSQTLDNLERHLAEPA